MTPRLNGRVAWVTGASGTIGRAVVRGLVDAGAMVFATARRRSALESLAAEEPDRITPLPADLGGMQAVTRSVERIVAASGAIDILVNSTTVPIFGPFPGLDDDQWSAVLNSKLLAYVRTMRAVLPLMEARGYGRIVNISGRGGRQPSAAHLPGACANAAVNVVSKGLADIYGARNIRINVVAPGPIRSDRLERLIDVAGRDGGNDGPGRLRLDTPIPRRGDPEDVANAVLYLVSDQSDYVTGAVLPVDGGGIAAL